MHADKLPSIHSTNLRIANVAWNDFCEMQFGARCQLLGIFLGLHVSKSDICREFIEVYRQCRQYDDKL